MFDLPSQIKYQIRYIFYPELKPIPASQAESIDNPKNIILPKSEEHESKYAKGLEILQKKMIRHETLKDEDNDFAPIIHEYGLIKNGDGYIFTDQDQTTHEFRTINQAIIYLSKQYKNEDFFSVIVSGDDQNDGNYVVKIKNDTAFTKKYSDDASLLAEIRKSIDKRIHGVNWDFQLENQTTGQIDYIAEEPTDELLKRYESEATFLDAQDRYYDVQSQTETIRLVEIVHDKEKNKWMLCDIVTGSGRSFDSREQLQEYLEGDFLSAVKSDEKFPTKVIEILDHTIEKEHEKTSWVICESGKTIKENSELLKTLSESKKEGKGHIKEWGLRYLHQNRLVPIATKKDGTSNVYKDIFERENDLRGGISKAGTFFFTLYALSAGINAYRTLTEGPALLQQMAKKEAEKIKAKENAQKAFEEGKEALKKFEGHEEEANIKFAKNVDLSSKSGPPQEGEEIQTAVYINLFGYKDLTKGGRAAAHADNLTKINKHYQASYYKDFSTSQDPVGDITAFLAALQATGHSTGLVFLSGHGNALHMSGLPLADMQVNQGNYAAWADYMADDASVILGGCETGAEIKPPVLGPNQVFMNYNPRSEMNAVQQLAEALASRGHIGNVYGNKEESVANSWEPYVTDNGRIEWKSLEFLNWRSDQRGKDIAFVQPATAYAGPTPEPVVVDMSAPLGAPPIIFAVAPSLQDFNEIEAKKRVVIEPEKTPTPSDETKVSEEPIIAEEPTAKEETQQPPLSPDRKAFTNARVQQRVTPPKVSIGPHRPLSQKIEEKVKAQKPSAQMKVTPSETKRTSVRPISQRVSEEVKSEEPSVQIKGTQTVAKRISVEPISQMTGKEVKTELPSVRIVTTPSVDTKSTQSIKENKKPSKSSKTQPVQRKKRRGFFGMIKRIAIKAWRKITGASSPSASSDLSQRTFKKKKN